LRVLGALGVDLVYIYIDESGTFVPKQGDHTVSCVGALTLAEETHLDFENRFAALKQKWGYGTNEVKGKRLGERQVMEFLALLKELDSIFHVCPTDLGCLSQSDVDTHQQLQAKQLLAHLTDKHLPSLINQCHEVSAKLAALSGQLYIQFCLMNELVDRQIQDVVIYYAFVRPKELGAFHWIVDAKNRSRTGYEAIWEILLPAFLQDRSLKGEPLVQVEGGDYSHFEKFYLRLDKWPDHLPKPTPMTADRPVDGINVKRIVGDSFCVRSSQVCLGLQAADICVNVFRRALMGRLLWPSWLGLGKLMLSGRGAAINFHFVTGHETPENLPSVAREYMETCFALNRKARSMFPSVS
jgi:hypothetical protein